MLIVNLVLIFLLSACVTHRPNVDFCGIYAPHNAECLSGKDIRTDDMIGYQCLSPDDFGALKKYYRSVNGIPNK